MTNQRVRDEVVGIDTMTRALAWAASRTPAARFLKAVGQDEFTFDVVVRVDETTYVVFDTT